MKTNRRRFKIVFVVFLVVTIVWALACYLHVQAYNKYIREETERFISMGFDENYVRNHVDFYPVLMWGHADVLFMIGFFMIFAWMVFLSELYRRK